METPGPTPIERNIGLTANGSPAAMKERRIVFAETALAAYMEYVSTKKLMHCWNITLKPAPMKHVATVGTAQWILGFAVQANLFRGCQHEPWKSGCDE